MKQCLFCGADNREDASHCYFCGNRLSEAPAAPPNPANRPGSTQPLHVRPGGANSNPTQPSADPYASGQPGQPPNYGTQPGTYGTRPGGQPSPYDTQPNAPYPTNPAPGGGYGQQGYGQQGQNQSGNTQPYQPPSGYPQGAYPQQQYGGGTGYPPPPSYPPAQGYPPSGAAPYPTSAQSLKRPANRFWPALAAILGIMLVCVCGFAVWTFTSAMANGVASVGDGMATQVADIFNAPTEAVQPTDPPVFEPSPWPTFTPEPTQAPLPTDPVVVPVEPTAAPAAETPDPGLEKLLSPECKQALDNIQAKSDEITTNPGAALDGAWRDAFGKAVDDMRTYCGSLDNASPVPGQLGEARKNLDLATESFDQASQLFNEGVDQRNPGKLLEAAGKIGDATKYLGLALEQMNNLGQ